ncbi:MFS transporter, partial [bacterium]|nr:MFS transporter [bacterium]
WTKIPEVGIMALAIFAFASGDLRFLLLVLFLASLQTTMYSPAKYGIIPEIVRPADLVSANGLVQMVTVVSALAGLVFGGLFLYGRFSANLGVAGWFLVGIALAGVGAALFLPRGREGNPQATFAWNILSAVRRDFLWVRRSPVLFYTVLGLAFFGFMASLLMSDIPVWGAAVLHIDPSAAMASVSLLAVGIGVGAMLAGRVSRGKVELGFVPLGGMGMALFAFDLWLVGLGQGGVPFFHPLVRPAADLVLLGVCGGLFMVPLTALLQQRAPPGEKGRLIAFSNVVSSLGVMLAGGVFAMLSREVGLSPGQVMLVVAFLALGGALSVLYLVPDFFVRLVLWMLVSVVYRIRVVGAGNLPSGGVLLVANHVSHVDHFLIAAASGRMLRFMVPRRFYEARWIGGFLRRMNAIPVAPGDSPEQARASVEQAREEIRRGHAVCVFAEGAVTRTGLLGPFGREFERIATGLDAPVVPVCLDGVWGSVFSHEGGKVGVRWPKRLPYHLTLLFGEPLPATATGPEVRGRIQALAGAAFAHRKERQRPLHLAFLQTARRLWRRPFMTAGGRTWSFGEAALAGAAMGRGLAAGPAPDSAGGGDRERLGIALPPGAGAALANLAALFAGRVPVNLPTADGAEALPDILAAAGIRRVISSAAAVASCAPLREASGPQVLFMEEMLAGASSSPWLRRLGGALPAWLLERLLAAGDAPDMDEVATILFTRGAGRRPRGVLLSHRNILANVEAVGQAVWLGGDDCILGAMPFAAPFGLTCTFWLPALLGLRVAYREDANDAEAVARLCESAGVTTLIARPSALAVWAGLAPTARFGGLRMILAGGEPLDAGLRRRFTEAFGVPLYEGYGCAECSPVVAVNVPDAGQGVGRRHFHFVVDGAGADVDRISWRFGAVAPRRVCRVRSPQLVLLCGRRLEDRVGGIAYRRHLGSGAHLAGGSHRCSIDDRGSGDACQGQGQVDQVLACVSDAGDGRRDCSAAVNIGPAKHTLR